MTMELLSKLPYDHPYRWDGTKFGSGKLWRPSDLGSGLALWLDAEDTDSITLNGSTVSQWSDKSGRNNHVLNATAATQPPYLTTAFNGKPTLSFTAAGQEFLFGSSFTNFSSVNDYFIGAVFEMFQSDRRWDMVAGWRGTPNAASAGGVPVLQGLDRQPHIGVHNTDIADVRIKVDVTTRIAKRIATIGRTGGTLGNNGTVTVTATDPSQPTYLTQGTQTWTSGSLSNFQIGGKQQGGTDYGDKYISEVVCCSRNLTTQEREKLEGYFAWKWALVDKLPAAHPYKLSPPFVIDPEAQKYLRAVEAADGQALEEGVRLAINDFVVGCKEDGIWDAIKASAILAGARTLGGALVPLTGAAPTNFNFVAGDYDRATGLKGDGSTKYLNSNRANDADPQNSNHNAVYITGLDTITDRGSALMAGGFTGTGSNNLGYSSSDPNSFFRNRSAFSTGVAGGQDETGLFAANRSTSSTYEYRFGGVTGTITQTSETPDSGDVLVFSRSDGFSTDARLSFYSIGESLDLAKLDARVSTLNSHIEFAVNTGLYAGDYSEETVAYVNAGYAAGGTLE